MSKLYHYKPKHYLIKKLIGIYEKDWQNAQHKSLVDELMQVHIQGVKGCKDMTIDELKHEIEEQQGNV